MQLSHHVMNRLLKKQAVRDPELKRDLERMKRPLLSQARALTDDALVAKLHSLGIHIDRKRLAELTTHHPSAESMARAIIEDTDHFDDSDYAEDWVWFALACL